MPLQTSGVDPGKVAALNDLLAVAMSQSSTYRVVTLSDLEAELGRDHLQQALGCDDVACAAEIGGSLGARFLLAGSARMLGSKVLVTLSLIDTEKRSTVRSKAVLDDQEERYPEGIDTAVGELLRGGAAPPPVVGNNADDMVLVPAGEFSLGCDAKTDSPCDSDEGDTPRKIFLDAYSIDRTEVTSGDYRRCVEAGKCLLPKQGSSYNYGSGRDNHPINGVDWKRAEAYCTWKGKALPTEAQWEKAARGPDARPYPWSTAPASCAHAVMSEVGWGCGSNLTWPVGSKPEGESPYGVLDMAGNISEWVADYYGRFYYSSISGKNPAGPSSGDKRVIRGGAFNQIRSEMRVVKRTALKPFMEAVGIGFRCAKPAP